MWKVRHEGSPGSVEMTLEAIQQGLLDGAWETTDEVMGPGETEWVAIEVHPALAELAAEIEPPPPKVHEDEARLDMTALIDVCLVLLVFFILTTTVASMETRHDAGVPDKTKPDVATIKVEQVQEQMIHVTAKMEDGRPVVRVEKTEVPLNRLLRELRGYVKGAQRTEMVLDHDDDVPHDVVVKVIDAAKGANVTKLRWRVP